MKSVKLLAFAVLLLLSAGVASSAAREIYPDPARARGDLALALKASVLSHKRILLDFGGNWCPDCQVLDIYFHEPANRTILEANFILVHVNVGRMDANLDIAERYEIPLRRGVPALAVLSDKGALLYSQRGGEFEDMRNLDSAALTAFLIHWKPR